MATKETKKVEVDAEETTGAEIAPVATKAKVDIAKESATDIEMTKKKLEKQEQVHFMIPLGEGEKVGTVHECFINGYKVSVQKGVMTKVPMAVANLLSETYKIGATAGADFRIDSDSKKQDALS
jgi:hypothetical protein